MSEYTEVQFIQTDAAEVEAEMVTTYELTTDKTLYPADPETQVVKGHALLNIQERELLNHTGRQNMVRYAEGTALEALGQLLEEDRLAATYSRVTLEFGLDEVSGSDVIIPAGTQATPDNTLMFATDEEATITAGLTAVQVTATCQAAGAEGNGFLAGQIDQIVDETGADSVTNTETSLGGADEETDDQYRARIKASANKVAKAGPRKAYLAHAMTFFSSELLDMTVHTGEPCEVWCYLLMAGGVLPSDSQRSTFLAYLETDEKLPEGVEILVPAPTTATYNVAFTYFVLRDYEPLASQIQTAVVAAAAAYNSWQTTKLGRDVTPSKLIELVMGVAGVKRVVIEEPIFTELHPGQVAQEGTTTATYGGVEDE